MGERRPAGRLTTMADVQAIRLHYNVVYAVESGGRRVLIDTGPDYRGAWEELQAALPWTPEIVVVTHGHIDHASLGARWQSIGVPVVAGEADTSLVANPALHRPGELHAMETYVESSGAPEEMAAEMMAGLRRRFDWASRAASDNYPPGGSNDRWPTPLRFEPFKPAACVEETWLAAELEAIMSPGHTPGNLVVVENAEGWLFSGDQLLPEITPTPAIQALPNAGNDGDWRFRSLPAFHASLRRIRDLELTMCFPGHGDPFGDVRDRIDANLVAIDSRTAKVRSLLSQRHPLSTWDLCEALYRRAAARRPWQILSTIQGHLDMLAEAEEVLETPDGWTLR